MQVPQSSGISPLILVVLVVAAAGAGVAGGYFWPGAIPPPLTSGSAPSGSLEAGPGEATSRRESAVPPAAGLTEFELSELDVRDDHQAPQLATDGDQRVWAAWESRTTADVRTIFLARSTDGGRRFTDPQVVRRIPVAAWEAMMRGKPITRESRGWTRLHYANGDLLLAWVEPQADELSRHTLWYMRSSDGGESFSAPVALSSADALRPTFIAFTASDDGRAAAAWLDHRSGTQQIYAAISDGQASHEKLVYGGPEGKGVCPCCHLSAAFRSDGELVLAFRNQVDGYRDLWMTTFGEPEGASPEPVPVAGKRWRFDGCPHDGPSLALTNDQAHLVFMDAHTQTPKVYYASGAAEGDFSVQPLGPDSTGSQGHPALTIDGESVHAVWDESLDAAAEGEAGHRHHRKALEGSGRAIYYTASSDFGKTFARPVPLHPVEGGIQSRPAIVSAEGTLCIAWCELSEAGKRLVIQSRAAEAPLTAAEQ